VEEEDADEEGMGEEETDEEGMGKEEQTRKKQGRMSREEKWWKKTSRLQEKKRMEQWKKKIVVANDLEAVTRENNDKDEIKETARVMTLEACSLVTAQKTNQGRAGRN
jgi:hypothetical protein